MKEVAMTSETPEHPGKLLKERYLDPLEISPHQLARAIATPERHVAEFLHGKLAMTPDLAIRLGLYFDVPAYWWLEMQARFDAHDPERLAALQTVVTPYDGLAHVLVTPTGVKQWDVPPPESAPTVAAVSANLLARLRAQVECLPRPLDREPEVVYFEDGTPSLTGR
jgi:addiction module HigA family antidote